MIHRRMGEAADRRERAARGCPRLRQYLRPRADGGPRDEADGARPGGNPVDLIGNPMSHRGDAPPPPTMPPRLGEQTDALLAEFGLSAEEVELLRSKKVI